MAKFHLDRLKSKYGFKGEKYEKLMKKVLAVEGENINKKILSINDKKFRKVAQRLSTKEQKISMPELGDILPKRAIFVNKAADRGKLISDTLRDSLTKNLRDTLKEFKTTSGKPSFLSQAGKTTGKINPDLLKSFESKIRKTFVHYTKKDPRFKVPQNIKVITVTEVRSTLNQAKEKYALRFQEINKDIVETIKRWNHNPSLSREPRKDHIKANGKTVAINKKFKIKNTLKGGFDMMSRPHDQSARLNQIIGCNCDFDTIVKRKAK